MIIIYISKDQFPFLYDIMNKLIFYYLTSVAGITVAWWTYTLKLSIVGALLTVAYPVRTLLCVAPV